MVRTEQRIIIQDRSTNPKFHTQELKSRSNNNFRKYFKLHIREMGPVNKSQFKTLKQKDDDFDATLRKEESLDQNNCMWLSSSGPSSPSSCLHDNGYFFYTDLKIDAWLISLLSTPSTKSREFLSTKVTFFDGSVANPIEEASLVLDQRKDLIFHENFEENEVVSWLATSIENETSGVSSITDSSDDYSFSSCSSSDYSSEVVDLEEIGTDKPLFWPSDWTFEWNSETKRDFFIMSPRKNTYKLDSDKGCNRKLVFDTQSKSPINLNLKNANRIDDEKMMRNKPSRFKNPTKTDNGEITEAKIVNESEPIDTWTNTPVFWPSDMDSDTKWDLFVMSPRKDVSDFSKLRKTASDSLRLRVLNGNMELENGCRRKLEFSKSLPNITEGGIVTLKNTRTAAIEAEDVGEVKSFTVKSVRKNRIVLEDLLLVDKLNVDDAIEEVLGLDEFDGREGLESEVDKEEVSLVDNL